MTSFFRQFSICLLSVLLFSMPLQAAEKFKIAISDLDALGVPENIALSAADLLRTELFNTGYFHVTERSQMNQILREQEFQLSGATEQDIIAIGKLLSVQMIALGSINRLGNLLILNVRLVDIEEARVRVAESMQAHGEEQLPAAIAALARKMADSIPIQGKVVAFEGERIIVSLGRADGVQKGTAFRVQRHGESYVDPTTNKALGRAVRDVALLRVDEVMGSTLSVASIVDDSEEIKLGDFVTILSGDAVTSRRVSMPVFSPSAVVLLGGRGSSPVGQGNANTQRAISILGSNNSKKIRAVARDVIKSRHFPSAILEAAEKSLLAGYLVRENDRHHIDAMAWLCRLLGDSKKVKYLATLDQVAADSKSKKLRKYAKKAAERLK